MITWVGRSPDVFATHGARVERGPSGWMLVWHDGERQRVRGPFQGGVEAAQDAWPAIRAKLEKDGKP